MYRFDDEPNFASFARALKAGNPDSIVGSNIPPLDETEHPPMKATRPLLLAILVTGAFWAAATRGVAQGESQTPIKAFCIDFNWGPKGINGFAGPGVWADASPADHVRWYEGLGANVIQTFAVSCNGYAWYKGGIVPPQPGLKHDFLTDAGSAWTCQGHACDGLLLRGCQYPLGPEAPRSQLRHVQRSAHSLRPRPTSITCAARWRTPSNAPAWTAL